MSGAVVSGLFLPNKEQVRSFWRTVHCKALRALLYQRYLSSHSKGRYTAHHYRCYAHRLLPVSWCCATACPCLLLFYSETSQAGQVAIVGLLGRDRLSAKSKGDSWPRGWLVLIVGAARIADAAYRSTTSTIAC